MLTISTKADPKWKVGGAILQKEPHVVTINEQWIDFPADGHVFLTSHTDRPGIIGRVGTTLGQADINISFMHVGRRAPRAEAIMALGTDELVPADLAATIEAWDDIIWLRTATV